MPKTFAELDGSIQAKLEADTEFQSSLESLTDEERTAKVNERKQSEIDAELTRLADEAEKVTKADEIARNQKIRAEKAETELKKLKGDGSPKTTRDDELSLTPKDTLAIIEAKVNSEDVEHVAKWAKFNGQTIAEALKDSTLKTVLREREEKRASEAAQNTKTTRPSSKVTGDTVYQQFKQGTVPEDEESIDKLAGALIKRKRASYKG